MTEQTERWRPVVGAEGFYEISDLGRVRSLQCQTGLRKQPLLLKPNPNNHGYFRVVFYLVDGKDWFIHTMVLTAFVGPRPEGLLARHLDGVLSNNGLSNLCWGTQVENMADSVAHGTFARGEKSGSSVLTENQVRAIRRAAPPYKKIGKDFGVTATTVCHIRNRKTWKHVA